MSGKIFVNYRRGDDAGFTQALYLRLEDEFTDADLFMDVEGHIKPGDDFVDVLTRQVAACDVLLAIIGPRWAELMAARADDPDDFVAVEIKAALDKGKRVIPVLVGGANMPRADTLPEAIRMLARRNAVGLRPERFKADCQGLVTSLKEQLAAAEAARAARTDAERLAVEAERQHREAEEAARIAAAEQRARSQAIEGLSPEEIRKTEELANWDFIKTHDDQQALRDHLARFPAGVTTLYAMTKLEQTVWSGLGAAADEKALKDFLDEFSRGPHADAARSRLAALAKAVADSAAADERRMRETVAWAAASTADRSNSYHAFLTDWPHSEHSAAAKARADELQRGPFRRRLSASVGIVGALMGFAGLFAVVSNPDFVDAVRPLPTFREPEMIAVPVGTFTMRSNDSDIAKPPHEVMIAPFEVGKYAVTFDEWDICVKESGCKHRPSASGWGRARRPVINVSWDDVTREYLPWLNEKTGKKYRLLTEAESEHATRAGTTTKYSFGDSDAALTDYAWFIGNSGGKSHPVGEKKPNAFGLYDMHGNVWQWTQTYVCETYIGTPDDGTAWTTACVDGGRRVVRGGSWGSGIEDLRSAFRGMNSTKVRYHLLGFRLARTLKP